jgi:hypothetical protein
MKTTNLIHDLRTSIESAKAQGDTAIPVAGLEAYLAEMERIASAQEEVAVEEKQRNDAIRKFEHDFEVWKIQTPLQSAANLEMFNSVIEAGQTAIKSAIIINGGAAAAMLAFLGNFLSADVEDANMFPISGIGLALLVFLLGVGCAGLASGFRYLVQATYAWGWRKSGHALNWVTIALGLASFASFFLGSIWGYLAIVYHHVVVLS